MSWYCHFCGFDSEEEDDSLCECRCHIIGRGIE